MRAYTACSQNAGAAAGDADESDAFSIPLLTQTLRSGYFAKYMEAILAIAGAVDSFARWAEACPCHDHLLTQLKSRYRREAMLQMHFWRSL